MSWLSLRGFEITAAVRCAGASAGARGLSEPVESQMRELHTALGRALFDSLGYKAETDTVMITLLTRYRLIQTFAHLQANYLLQTDCILALD